MRFLIQLGFGKVGVPVCSSLLRHGGNLVLLYCMLFLMPPDFFFFVSCLLRDFQFGHMDGNDYINSLIMGWVSRNASSPLSSHITLLFSPPHITCCQLLNQVWTDLYCQPPPLKMLLCGEVNYTDRLPSLFFSSVLGNFNHPLLSRKRTTRAPTNLLVRSIYEDCMDEGHAWIISIAVMCF